MNKWTTFTFRWALPALIAALLLTACAGGISFVDHDFIVGIEPNPIRIDIEVDDDGTVTYVSQDQVLTFANFAGAIGATIEGYDIEYYDASDNFLFPGDSVVRNADGLNIYVPPGIVCEEPDPVLGCTVNSPGARFARGPAVSSTPSGLAPPDIAFEDFDLFGIGGAVGAYAKIYFYGTDDVHRPFRTAPHQISMIIE